ncbi:MAG: signal peptidase I [Pseudomonadota bacterium]|nr:signal peptidase I [Pseudomonadota bacterium]
MNLALILVSLTMISGIFILSDILFWKKKQVKQDEKVRVRKLILEYSYAFFPVLFFVLVIRSFIFEPFRIPSGSMKPTLLVGDFIFVKKYSYGLRLPVLEKKIWNVGNPERGDVAVFRLPSDPNINYIKRVIGLPGDKIIYQNHKLTINGYEVGLVRDADNPYHEMTPQFIETIDENDHTILISSNGFSIGEGYYEVPEKNYFMMGDNRDNSRDSRFIDSIPEEYLVGKAARIWMHMDGLEWPDYKRIGQKIN